MRHLILAIAIATGLMAPLSSAHAEVCPVAVGAVLGGLAGSVYASGVNATAAMVGSATAATANAIGAAAPAVASGVAGAIAAASTPVIVGVVVGGALGYLLFY